MGERRLEAGGWTLRLEEDGRLVAGPSGGQEDWLGPLGPGSLGAEGRRALQPAALEVDAGQDGLGTFGRWTLRWEGVALPITTSLRTYPERELFVFRLEAREALSGLATGAFTEPRLAFPWLRPAERAEGGVPEGTRSFGYQYTEFAFPVSADDRVAGAVFVPHRPRVVLPLGFAAPDGRTLLLAPLDGFHEQVIAVPESAEHVADGVRCGWHGDLDRVPAGWASELALVAAGGPRAALERWGELLRERYGTVRRGRYGDEMMARLSYWTDNGGVYYYRTAPGCDYATTLERAVEDLESRGIPVGAIHLDSWFYPHRHPRAVSEEGAPVVPPSGMLSWEPRDDVFPEGLDGLRARLGGRPLSFHSRHFSSLSPYFERHPAWVDGEQAHPADPDFFHLLMERAARWGALTYEQDWMVESFLGVRGLREEPGRADAWQRGMDAAASERGLTLLWCMSTPADFMQTVRLREVNAIRTSGDYQYLYDNALNWVWFLRTNALARALGLWPYKDVFLSHDKTPEGFGEPLAEAESLLAGLSGGPVGIGDQIGHARPERVWPTCREDGVLIKPDLPLAAVDGCFGEHGYFGSGPLVAETLSRHPAGTWVYVVVMNASHRTKQASPLEVEVRLAELGAVRPQGPVIALDWRSGDFARLEPDGGWREALAYQDFSYRVLCPLLPGEATVFGDVSKFATVGDRRVARIRAVDGGLAFEVLGVPGAGVRVQGYAARRPAGAQWWSPAGAGALAPDWAADGRWRLEVPLDATGVAHVTLRLA